MTSLSSFACDGWAKGGLARDEAVLEKAAFHRIAREGERGAEVPARGVRPAAAKFKFAERGMIKGIVGEPLGIRNGVNLFEAAVGAIALRDGDGTIERHDRRRANGHQFVVERNDHSP